jgi:hypothetical protein
MVDGQLVRLAEHVRETSLRERTLRRDIGRLEAKIAGGHSDLIRLLESRHRELSRLAEADDRGTPA